MNYRVLALSAAILISPTSAQAEATDDPMWPIFQRSPNMVDNCATKLASGAEINRNNGWPAYCNKFENTDIVQKRAMELRGNAANFSSSDRAAAQEGRVRIGMSAEAAEAAWGRPKSINRSTGSWGTTEQWVYGVGNYLYFRNGKLESFQN